MSIINLYDHDQDCGYLYGHIDKDDFKDVNTEFLEKYFYYIMLKFNYNNEKALKFFLDELEKGNVDIKHLYGHWIPFNKFESEEYNGLRFIESSSPGKKGWFKFTKIEYDQGKLLKDPDVRKELEKKYPWLKEKEVIPDIFR